METDQTNNGTNEQDHVTVCNQGDLAYQQNQLQKHGGGHAAATTTAALSASLSAATPIAATASAAVSLSPAVSASAAVSLSLVSSATVSSPAVPTVTVVPVRATVSSPAVPAVTVVPLDTGSHHGNEPVIMEAEVVGWVRAGSTEESKRVVAQLDSGVWETDVMTSRVGHPTE